MNVLKCLLPVAALSALTTVLQAQPVPYWSTVDPRPDSRWVNANAAAFDAAGNGFVMGISYDLDEPSGEPTGGHDKLTVTKFLPSGTVAWRVQYPYAGDSDGLSRTQILPAGDGGAFVYEEYSIASHVPGGQLIRFSSAGQVLWTKGTFDAIAAATDGSFFGSTSDPSSGDYFGIDKYDAQGNLLWGPFTDSSGYLGAITPDASGGAWAAGRRRNDATGLTGLLLAHYDSNGNPQFWDFPTVGFYPTKLLIDSSGNFIVGGKSPGASSTYKVALAKISSTGELLWSHVYADTIDQFFSLPPVFFALDPTGNTYFGYDLSEYPKTPQFYKINANGDTVWSHSFVVANVTNQLRDLLVDPGGNLFILFSRSAGNQNGHYGLVKYLPSGDLGWPSLPSGELAYGTNAFDDPIGLGRDASGFLYAGGLSFADRAGHHVVKFGAANNSHFVSQSAIPTSMVAGQTYSVWLTFSNTGVQPWTFGDFYLRSINPTDNMNWSRNRVDLGTLESIAPGQSKKFQFSVYAPTNGGTFNFQWRMANGTSSFGDGSTNVLIPVTVKQHAARYISQTVPSSVKAGSTFTVKVSMRNVGTNLWTLANGYALASIEPDLNTRWNVSTVPLAAGDNIARGQGKTFTFSCKAPSKPGTYSMRWQMHRASGAFTGFFGDKATVKTITVTP